MRIVDRVESVLVDGSSERGVVERTIVLVCTLYCLLLITLPSTYGALAAWLIALLGAVRGTVWRGFYGRYRLALWGMVALVLVNALVARFPAKVVPGAGELIRSVSFMLPAIYVMQYCHRQVTVRALKALVGLIVVGCIAIYAFHVGSADVTGAIYNWSLSHVGNVHNLVNMAAMALLALVVLATFEAEPRQKAVLFAMLAFMLWFLVVLESEGAFLALLITACAWGTVRFTGGLRMLSALGVAAGVFAYVLLMVWLQTEGVVPGASPGSFEIRALINARLLELVAAQPWFGYGINSFKYVTEAAVDGVMYIHPHQIYLEALFSFGMIGCFLLAAVLWGFFRLSSQRMILSEPLPMLGFLATVYMAGKGLSDMKLMSVQPLAIFMLGAGLMARTASWGRPAGNGDLAAGSPRVPVGCGQAMTISRSTVAIARLE